MLIARAISASSQKISNLLQSYEELINTGPARGGLVFHIERPARDWRSPTERAYSKGFRRQQLHLKLS